MTTFKKLNSSVSSPKVNNHYPRIENFNELVDDLNTFIAAPDITGNSVLNGNLDVTGDTSLTGSLMLIGNAVQLGDLAVNGEIKNSYVVSHFEDFFMQTINETDFGVVLHKNAGGSDPAIAAVRVGGEIDCVTGGTTADGSELQFAHPVTCDLGGLIFEARVKLSAITSVKVFIGLTDVASYEHPFSIDNADAVTATADDAVGFVFDTTAATDKWFCCAVDSTTVDTGSGVTTAVPVATTYQTFRIALNSTGTALDFYVNGSLVKTLSAAGVSPNVSLYPTICISELNNSARTAVVDYVKVKHTR
jgi:hypothetical protein